MRPGRGRDSGVSIRIFAAFARGCCVSVDTLTDGAQEAGG